MPENKQEKRLLSSALRQARKEKPIRFYIGSCPDYSHNGRVYTHGGLGEGVPFLTLCHLEADIPMLSELEKVGIAYQYVIMIADVEATDEVFCERFTQGNEGKFLMMCRESQRKTEQLMKNFGLNGKLRSSSFFEEFGRTEFMRLQTAYQAVLSKRYVEDASFRMRVDMDTIQRGGMYQQMYPGIYEIDDIYKRHEFLIGRTVRTMAQYLALGRLIGEKTAECFPIIIVHPTCNKGVFNERNRFLLPGDGPQPQPTIPIFEMKRRVY